MPVIPGSIASNDLSQEVWVVLYFVLKIMTHTHTHKHTQQFCSAFIDTDIFATILKSQVDNLCEQKHFFSFSHKL